MQIGGQEYKFRFFHFDRDMHFVGLGKMQKKATKILGDKAKHLEPSTDGQKVIEDYKQRLKTHGTKVKFGTLVDIYDEKGTLVGSGVTFCSAKEKQINKHKGKIEAVKDFVESCLEEDEKKTWVLHYSDLFPAIKHGFVNAEGDKIITANEAATAATAPRT